MKHFVQLIYLHEKSPSQNTFLDIILGVNLCVCVCGK